ncbi:hypothetical protein AS9A_3297 [Hoyosella subflava DQS3-9A1]|uniref:DUF664 domain-containing protein n=1 Tax=Hoyosella subflava (strain DSM 45089 / JCM 17490 / NBRC 109087 / DQS3-9A1) TaxID=443218 RepID=F6EP79_HOYSD|nr:hypothetical protein AS9A_3297 [Hoyosella subflava DQS3-9A1]
MLCYAPADGGRCVFFDCWDELSRRIEETGRHAGHADILRELIDGATGR